jgi:GcrA cell cycle regulator
MEWNEETIARLRALWAEGLSTAEIGRRMGVSKNAVVGKAHRLNLLARPSPIRRDVTGGAARSPAPRRVTGPTLPPLPLSAAAPVAVAAPAVTSQAGPRPLPAMRAEAAAPRPAPVRAAAHRPSRLVTCCWPIGEPGTKSFRFCDADATTGKPYCAEHAALAYVKVRDRRDEAAA